MPPTPAEELQASDLDWCHDAVEDVSRTFALTVSELDEPMTDYICVGYLLCRIPDTIEDAAHIPPTEQYRLLARYRDAIDPEKSTTVADFRSAVDKWIPDTPDADWEVVAESERVVATFRAFDADARAAMRPPIIEMADGMATFVHRYRSEGGLRLQTTEELEEYCWYVAGTVGELVTSLLAPDATDDQTVRMRENARSFALLLQIVNIAKDIRDDYREEDNVYVPASLLDAEGLAPGDIDDSSNSDAFAPIVRALVDHAEQYADGAEAWLDAQPRTRGNTLSAFGVPFLLAIATIRELRARPEDVIAEGEVKVDREEVFALLDEFAGDEPSVTALREQLQEQPLHEIR